MVYLPTDSAQATPLILRCLERQSYPDNLEWVGEENADTTSNGAAHESSNRRLLLGVRYHDRAHLLVGEEFNASVWEDTEESG